MYGVVIRPEAGDGLMGWLAMVGAMPSPDVTRAARAEIIDGGGDTCQHIHPKCGCVERMLRVYVQVFKITFPLQLALAVLSAIRSGSGYEYICV